MWKTASLALAQCNMATARTSICLCRPDFVQLFSIGDVRLILIRFETVRIVLSRPSSFTLFLGYSLSISRLIASKRIRSDRSKFVFISRIKNIIPNCRHPALISLAMQAEEVAEHAVTEFVSDSTRRLYRVYSGEFILYIFCIMLVSWTTGYSRIPVPICGPARRFTV